MDSATPQPLTVEQAKAAFRVVAAETQTSAITSLESRKPMLVALIAGVLAGSEPGLRRALAKILTGLLFE